MDNFEQLDNLGFADDLALLAHNQNQMQDKTCRLETFSAKTGLRINLRKTELIKINTTANTPITVGGEPIKEVKSFVYLGSTITKQGGTDEDETSRIGKARARGAFIIIIGVPSLRRGWRPWCAIRFCQVPSLITLHCAILIFVISLTLPVQLFLLRPLPLFPSTLPSNNNFCRE